MTPRIFVPTILSAAINSLIVGSFSSSVWVVRSFHRIESSTFLTRKHLRVQNQSRFPSFLCSMPVPKLNNHISFVDFLDSIKLALLDRLKKHEYLNDCGKTLVKIYIGNEAGDADSIVSALALACINNLFPDNDCPSLSSITHVPIISVPRQDIQLRRDAVLLLDMAGINITSLLYIDDEIVSNELFIDSNSLLSQTDRKIVLLDHNRIRSTLAHLSHLVSEIIDHHQDECSHEEITSESGKRIIAFAGGSSTVASTCTLVTEQLLQSMTPSMSIDRAVGLTLLGVILIDSINMLPEAGKGTVRDEEAINALLKRTEWSSNETVSPTLTDESTLHIIFPNGLCNMPDRTALFEYLNNAKFDRKFWYEMSIKDCLRIDYKKLLMGGQSPHLIEAIGVASILIDTETLLLKERFHKSLAEYVSYENLDLLGVLSMYFKDGSKPSRELFLTGSKQEVVDSFAQHLLEHPDAAPYEFEERPCRLSEDEENVCLHARLFIQGNVKMSRKQIIPLLLNHARAISRL